MAKNKLKWCREGADNYEDLYLIPVGKEFDAEGDFTTDAAVAWIRISYDRTRFYNGRGGEGTSRPDAYVAIVFDASKKPRERVIVDGADTVADIGGLFSTRMDKAFRSLRDAKVAIKKALTQEVK